MSPRKLIIGVTDCSKYATYSNWVQQYDHGNEIIKLGYKEGNFDDIKKCDGIVLTGGEDVHPRYYKKPDYYRFCYEDDISESRDEFEWKVLEYTERNHVPVLGICRGMQLANVFFGGTLIPDLPAFGKDDHSKLENGLDRYHELEVSPSSWMQSIVRCTTGIVNSNHHQSIENIAGSLVVSAVSPDGVIEAAERKSGANGSFLCLLQWHPERMTDQQSPFVKNILDAFMEAVRNSL